MHRFATLFAAAAMLAFAPHLPAKDASNEGREFFQERVVPRLAENGCPACHSVGYVRPNVLVYEELLRRLAIGDSPENNAVIYKIANLRSIAPDRPNHPGGQRCAGIDAEPCRSVREWWSVEFGGEEKR
jgi:hypothetical protein